MSVQSNLLNRKVRFDKSGSKSDLQGRIGRIVAVFVHGGYGIYLLLEVKGIGRLVDFPASEVGTGKGYKVQLVQEDSDFEWGNV